MVELRVDVADIPAIMFSLSSKLSTEICGFTEKFLPQQGGARRAATDSGPSSVGHAAFELHPSIPQQTP